MTRSWRSALRQRLVGLALGTDDKHGRLVARTWMALLVYLVSMAAEGLAVALGLTDADDALRLVGSMFIGPVLFLGLVRSGWSRRFDDPGLTLVQMVYAIAMLTFAYAINGPLRGLNVLLIALVPLFGFLKISRRQAALVCACSLIALGGAMLPLAILQPERYDPRVEAMHFAIAAICLPSMALLLKQIGAMRARARAQGEDLRRALQRIEAVSIRDELTGLFNRHHMTELLAEEMRRRQRGGPPFCLALIDIDHFKRVNDLHGHAQGDEVLRSFARIALQSIDGAAVLARWGGEEFLLMLPATSLAAGAEVLARCRERMADASLWPAAELQVSFSAGLVEDGLRPLSVLLELADQALYRAKAGGRDRVEQAAAAN